MKQAGRVYASPQDEASCVVFGMPKEAIKLGGCGQGTCRCAEIRRRRSVDYVEMPKEAMSSAVDMDC